MRHRFKRSRLRRRYSVAELQSRITFTPREFRGFGTHTGAAARERGADYVVDVKPPIIDGTDER